MAQRLRSVGHDDDGQPVANLKETTMRRQFPQTHNVSRRSLLKWIGSVGLVLSGCSPAENPTMPAPEDSPVADDEATEIPSNLLTPLRVAFTTPPEQFDPARMATTEAYHFAYAIYDALVWIDQSLTVQPLLALSWEANRSLSTWTFTLRQGVTFHNGAEMTSADVVYTFNRLIDPQFGSSLLAVLRVVEAVEALDDYTVRFHLVAPNAEFPLLLGAPQAGIVPDQITTAQLAASPVGAGPFKFVESVPGERIRMLRNADYWDAEGFVVRELEFVYFTSFSAQATALKTGGVHILPDINLQDLAAFIDDPKIEVLDVTSGRYQTIVMQATEAPFNDVRVRQALKLCADRIELQRQVLQNRGVAGSDHPVAPISPFSAELPLPVQNVEQARRLLADAGYPSGLNLSLITSASRPGMLELANAFRDHARPAGVEVEVIEVPPDVYWTDYSGKVPFHVGNWNFRASIDETFTIAYHSQSPHNESNWRNKDFDALIEEARSEGDIEQRKALYAKAQQFLLEDGAVVIPYFRSVLMAVRSSVQGLDPHPSGFIDFSRVTLTADS